MAVKNKETIKVLRARKEITQEELAFKSGIAARTVHLFEKDVNNLRKAKYETLLKLANGLNVEVDDIFLG